MNPLRIHIIIKVVIVLLGVAMMFWAYDIAEPAKPDPPNILIITVDCLRPDHMGLYGYERNTTPNIDRFFKKGVRFTRAFSQASWTSPSLISLFTSWRPGVHGMDARGKTFDRNFYTPLKQLREQGYAVLTYTWDDNYTHQGWTAKIPKGKLIETLRQYRDRRFFAWYHFRETHLPYAPPSPFKEQFRTRPASPESEALSRITRQEMVPKGSVVLTEEDGPMIRDLYDAEVRYQDHILGELFEFLRSSGLDRRTWVILTADHGEELMEHGFIGHASTSKAATVFDELIRIPLLIYVSGREMGSTVDSPVQQVDLMPTLFEALGLRPKFFTQGQSFLDLMEGRAPKRERPVFIETSFCGWQCSPERRNHRLYAVRTRQWKLVESRVGNEIQRKLFDLVHDPGETRDRLREHPDIAHALTGKLHRWQEENLRAARDLAEQAVRGHLKSARQAQASGQKSVAATELQQARALHRVYADEKPSFVLHPRWGAGWRELMDEVEDMIELVSTEPNVAE